MARERTLHGGPLACSCGDHDVAGADADRDPVTQNVTDLRQARERARGVVRQIADAIQAWLERNDYQRLPESASAERKVNDAITRLASEEFREELLPWLKERRHKTMGRAARAAHDRLQSVLSSDTDLRTEPSVGARDRELNNLIQEVDAGLLEKLASDAGDRITRQLKLGVREGESVQDLGERVDYVLVDGDPDGQERQKLGVNGQTVKSKGELIAHDSVQQAYTLSSTRRYLRNGFKYVRYQATLDTKTTNLCRRLDGELIDLTNGTWIIPPNHPWCRSSTRPVLESEVEGEEPLERDDLAADYLGTVNSTNSYRPPVMDPSSEYQPAPI